MAFNPELSERIEACIAVELLAAEIYMLLAEAFPEDRNFFMDLCLEEESHASILSLTMGFQRVGDVPDYVVPSSFIRIYETFSRQKEIKEAIEQGDLSLKDALGMVHEMESSLGEKYFQEVFGQKDSDAYIINKLKGMQIDSKQHAEKIADFMKLKGLRD